MDELAQITGLSSRLLYCLSMKTSNYYKSKEVPKRNGNFRKISIPSYTLHIVQRWILINILNKILPSNRAMAFRRGKLFGHKQNAFYHMHTLYGLSIDLKDFFPSITANKVYTVFSNIGYNNFAATILTNLCTLDGKLPQGSACSPALSNIVCISLDKRFIGLCEKRGIRFTRYADDMYFSCDDKALLLKIHPIIIKIINDEGFVINNNKTHFHTPSNKKTITGVTVATTNKEDIIDLKAPRVLKKKVRTEIFKSVLSGKYENIEHVVGEISYISFIEKENETPYLPRITKYIQNTATKIQYFPELVAAYNNNRFFDNFEPLDWKEISINDEDKYEYFEYIFKERKEYLQKNGLDDICMYSTWPQSIVNSKGTSENLDETNDAPF